MGIFPYQTPAEREASKARIKHYSDFIANLGYKNAYEIDPNNSDRYLPRTKPFKASNGIEYKTAEEFYKGYGYYPGLEKDGICYGWYEPRERDGYIDPWYDEVNFLESKGYNRNFRGFSEDYLENNRLEEEYYNKNGFVPRWGKDGKYYGHAQILELERYKYPWGN